jgi:stage III sporulation protein SpoIIIAA
MINVNDKPVTYGVLRQWLETLLDKPVDTPSKNGSRSTEASGLNDSNGVVNDRNNATQLASASNSEFPAQVEPAYKPNETLLGKEVARAVQFLPKEIIQELERKVRAQNINPQTIEEFQIDLGRHVRVDTGASSKEAAKNGLGISPLTLLGDPTKESDNVPKIKQEDLNKIKSSIMFNLESGRGGLKDVEDLSRFSISERNGLPVNITIRVGKAVEIPLPEEIQKIVLDAVQNKKKVLFLGQTGVGKTTLIRQISKFLSDKGVSPTIFDKSEEIAGHGSTPHSALGNLARRFVIQPFKNVAQSLISMIENHNPKALIIDELSDREQFSGVRRMVDEKGIPTAFIFTHGTTLGMAMHSDNTKELLAKVDTVIVGDDTAQKTGNGDVQDKIRHNVIGHSMVDVVVEMPARGVFVVHENTLDSMKKLAAGEEPTVKVYPKGTNIREYRSKEAEQFIEPKNKLNPTERPALRQEAVSNSQALVNKAISNEESDEGVNRKVQKGAKPAETIPPSSSTSQAKYPLLVKNYKKDEIDSMPFNKLTELKAQLLGKQKGEGNLPRVQKQRLDWVNAAIEKQRVRGQQRLDRHNRQYNLVEPRLTQNQQRQVSSLNNTLDQLEQERKQKEAAKRRT